MAPVRRRGDLHDAADRLDPKALVMLVDEALQDLMRRSSSAWAKNALASLRISLALRSSRFSRSWPLMRWASDVETPSRYPASTSCWRTQACSVCGTQPILLAMNSTAAHCDGCSWRCSSTMRTARSRTSDENFGDFLMAPFSSVGASSKPGAVQGTPYRHGNRCPWLRSTCRHQPRLSDP